jgi:hypothetical protein
VRGWPVYRSHGIVPRHYPRYSFFHGPQCIQSIVRRPTQTNVRLLGPAPRSGIKRYLSATLLSLRRYVSEFRFRTARPILENHRWARAGWQAAAAAAAIRLVHSLSPSSPTSSIHRRRQPKSAAPFKHTHTHQDLFPAFARKDRHYDHHQAEPPHRESTTSKALD